MGKSVRLHSLRSLQPITLTPLQPAGNEELVFCHATSFHTALESNHLEECCSSVGIQREYLGSALLTALLFWCFGQPFPLNKHDLQIFRPS